MSWSVRVLLIISTILIHADVASAKISLANIEMATGGGAHSMRVIVRMKSSLKPASSKSKSSDYDAVGLKHRISRPNVSTMGELERLDSRVALLARKLDRVGQGVFNRRAAISRFDGDLIALSMTRDELLMMAGDSDVEIHEDKILRPSLSSSIPVVFSNQATAGFNGGGRTVALLDFGVSPNHSFLNGRLRRSVSACFSNRGVSSAGQSNPSTESLCINEAASSVGGVSGDNCSPTIFGCEHGTMMAGIIAGSGNGMTGVATGTQIISIQVGTQINDETVCGDASITPCVGAFSFDIQEALNYVNSIAGGQRVAAVNISLGTEATLQGICDDDPLRPAVDNLFFRGVGVIASSGNSSSPNSMSSPACISRVIAVAATDNSDSPLSINNRSSELDFFAPGAAINTSSLPASGFATVTGTSAAAAHVSGAWAVLKQKVPAASVAAVSRALRATGVNVAQGVFARRRIRIGNALNSLQIPDPSEGFCFPIVTQNQNVATICL